MRIELNSGGLSSRTAVLDFQYDFDYLIDRSRKMISSFQTIKNFANNMNGGIGNLQGAVDQIGSRISTEETKAKALNSIKSKANSFMELTRQVDLNVCGLVNRNKHEFYNVNPWSKPPPKEKEKGPIEKGIAWLCEKGEEIKEGFNNLKDTVVDWGRAAADSISKAWNNAVDWCKAHKEALIKVAISVVVVVALGVLAAATAGAGLVAVAGIADLAFKGAIIGGVVGATAKGATSGYKYYKEHGTLEGAGGQIFDSAADGMLSGTITGAATGAASGVGTTLMTVGNVSKGAATGAASGVGTTLMTVGNVSKGAAITSQILAGGIANGTGSAGVTALDYYFENGTLKGAGGEVTKSFAVNFASGSINQGVMIGGTALKHTIASNIDQHIANHTANGFEKFLAHSDFTIKGFNSALKNPWFSSQVDAQSALFKNLAKYSAIGDTVKTKVTEKAINNLTQIIFGEGHSYTIPKPYTFIEDTIGNFLDFGKGVIMGT